MKYTFQFGAGEKRILETRAGESRRHIILKVLAYLLYRDKYPDRLPEIEVRVWESKREYKPDVVALREDGSVALWVDCGQIAIRKLDDLTRKLRDAEIVVVKATIGEMEAYAREAARRMSHPDRITFIGFGDGFVDGLVDALGHVNEVAASLSNGALTLNMNKVTYVTEVRKLPALNQTGRICESFRVVAP